MKNRIKKAVDFGNDDIFKILIRLAPPIMLAQLIQALYNIIDSYFIGKYSESGLTALSIVYPLQLLMIALAVGTGVGINTLMAHFLGIGRKKESRDIAGMGTFLALISWLLFALISYFVMPFYARISTNSQVIIKDVVTYGTVVSVFSMGLFFESMWSKILQAYGNMSLPMVAQIIGAIINIIVDPLLIFGYGIFPEMGICGAAIATVLGQIAAALIVMTKGYYVSPKFKIYKKYLKNIYFLGFPNMLMQSAYTFYIMGLNLILKGFSDQAVTVLGLYYKWQTFFFIPLGAMQTCIIPVLSYNYSAGLHKRCKKTLYDSIIFGVLFMLLGVLFFECIPAPMLSIFSKDKEVIRIGKIAFRIIGISFIPLVTSLIYPVFFQAIGSSVSSSFLTVLRTVVLFVPLAYIFSRISLDFFWLTYPITEIITTITGFILYKKYEKKYILQVNTGKKQ